MPKECLNMPMGGGPVRRGGQVFRESPIFCVNFIGGVANES